jgi:hypothetical protein
MYQMYEGSPPQDLPEARRGIKIPLTFFGYGFSVCHPNTNNLIGVRENLLIKGEVEKGVKGILPLGCLPLGGERGHPHSFFQK